MGSEKGIDGACIGRVEKRERGVYAHGARLANRV